jgi:hypothetical protein
VLVDKRDRQPIGQIAIVGHDGRTLTWHELQWQDRGERTAEARAASISG